MRSIERWYFSDLDGP